MECPHCEKLIDPTVKKRRGRKVIVVLSPEDAAKGVTKTKLYHLRYLTAAAKRLNIAAVEIN